VTKGLIRIYGQKHLHFLTFSTYRRQRTLSLSRRTHVLQQLEAVRQQKPFQVCGYVVMPEHFHVLIGESEIGTPRQSCSC
jgi:putative transposase